MKHVCYQFLCVCVCVCVRAHACTLSCPTLCDPIDCSLPGSSVLGIFWQEYWSGLPLPIPEDLSDPGIETPSPGSPELAGGFLTTGATWETMISLKFH